jgi:hypothetical protein
LSSGRSLAKPFITSIDSRKPPLTYYRYCGYNFGTHHLQPYDRDFNRKALAVRETDEIVSFKTPTSKHD